MNTYLLLFVAFAILAVQLPSTLGYSEADELDAFPEYQTYGYPSAYNRFAEYRKRGIRNMRMGKRSEYHPVKAISTE
ncbi:unnamed protein product [Trichobilharzia szidati]|nr:unnamed protein product [Trichobilharzia szidati]